MTRAEIIGANIQKYRNAMGMSQVDFAQAIGRSQTMVSMYESGQRIPSTKIIGKIANVLGVTFDEIWEEKKVKNDYDWYSEAFDPKNDFPQGKYDDVTEKRLVSLGEQLSKAKKSKEWRMLSEGFEQFEKKRKDEFLMVFKMLSKTYPEFFNERNDDDADTPES